MKQKPQKPTKTSGKRIALVVALAIGATIAIVNVILLIINFTRPPLRLGEEFTMRAGEHGLVRELKNRNLQLVEIQDGRCPNDGTIVCSWEGQIYYKFIYDGDEIIVGSVLDNDTTRKLDNDTTINFVRGNEKSGTFILRKDSE